jgi:hypothetical protein
MFNPTALDPEQEKEHQERAEPKSFHVSLALTHPVALPQI